MAFQTRYRVYESLVIPFSLTNAPGYCQHLINDTLHTFLDHFYMVYIDDILIYSAILEKSREHMRRVLEALSRAGLHLKPEKCHFHKTEVKYLGLIISGDRVRMDPEKVMAMLE